MSAAPRRGRSRPGKGVCLGNEGRVRSPWVCTATFGTCSSSPRRPGPAPAALTSAALRLGPAAARGRRTRGRAGPGSRADPGRRAGGVRCAEQVRRREMLGELRAALTRRPRWARGRAD